MHSKVCAEYPGFPFRNYCHKSLHKAMLPGPHSVSSPFVCSLSVCFRPSAFSVTVGTQPPPPALWANVGVGS